MREYPETDESCVVVVGASTAKLSEINDFLIMSQWLFSLVGAEEQEADNT